MRKAKKVLAVLLAFCMVITMMPLISIATWAADEQMNFDNCSEYYHCYVTSVNGADIYGIDFQYGSKYDENAFHPGSQFGDTPEVGKMYHMSMSDYLYYECTDATYTPAMPDYVDPEAPQEIPFQYILDFSELPAGVRVVNNTNAVVYYEISYSTIQFAYESDMGLTEELQPDEYIAIDEEMQVGYNWARGGRGTEDDPYLVSLLGSNGELFEANYDPDVAYYLPQYYYYIKNDTNEEIAYTNADADFMMGMQYNQLEIFDEVPSYSYSGTVEAGKTVKITCTDVQCELLANGCYDEYNPPVLHIHSLGAWKYNDSYHWKECEADNCSIEIFGYAAHTWDEGELTTPATVEQDGVITYTCECGKTKTETVSYYDTFTKEFIVEKIIAVKDSLIFADEESGESASLAELFEMLHFDLEEHYNAGSYKHVGNGEFVDANAAPADAFTIVKFDGEDVVACSIKINGGMLTFTLAVPETHECSDITFDKKLDSSFTGGTLEAGNYYLSEDITLVERITIPADTEVNLCLNGKVINASSVQMAIINTGTLSIYDCDSTTEHSVGEADEYTVVGGVISGSSVACIEVNAAGTVTLYSGNVAGADWYNVVVRGNFVMNGGKLIASERGIYICDGASAIMNDGEVCYNGIDSYETLGGAVYVDENAEFTMNGGSIHDNMAGYGGGVYTEGQATLLGGTISNNISCNTNKNCAGGVAVYGIGHATFGGSIVVKDNTWNDKPSNVWVLDYESSESPISVVGTSITMDIGVGSDTVPNFGTPIELASGLEASVDYKEFITSDDIRYTLQIEEDDDVKLILCNRAVTQPTVENPTFIVDNEDFEDEDISYQWNSIVSAEFGYSEVVVPFDYEAGIYDSDTDTISSQDFVVIKTFDTSKVSDGDTVLFKCDKDGAELYDMVLYEPIPYDPETGYYAVTVHDYSGFESLIYIVDDSEEEFEIYGLKVVGVSHTPVAGETTNTLTTTEAGDYVCVATFDDGVNSFEIVSSVMTIAEEAGTEENPYLFSELELETVYEEGSYIKNDTNIKLYLYTKDDTSEGVKFYLSTRIGDRPEFTRIATVMPGEKVQLEADMENVHEYKDDILYQDAVSEIWYYYLEDEVAEDYRGIVENGAGKWYVVDGKIAVAYTSIAAFEDKLAYVCTGKVAESVNRLINIEGSFYWFVDGICDLTYTGLIEYAGATWYVVDGVVATDVTGIVEFEGGLAYVCTGKVATSVSRMVKYNDEFYWFVEGICDRTYEGLAENAGITWFVTTGKLVSLDYKGMVTVGEDSYYIRNGKVDNVSGVIRINNEFLYVTAGKLNKDFTGIIENNNAKWYIVEGKLSMVNIEYEADGVTYVVRSGKVAQEIAN